jgi:hypothetical protein
MHSSSYSQFELRYPALISLLLLSTLILPVAGAEPLHAHNLHPLYAPLIQFRARSAAIQPPNSIELAFLQSYGNNFFLDTAEAGNSEIVAELDSEAAYTTIAARCGLSPHLELNFSVMAMSHFPGVLDGFLQWYHGLFGFPNADRELRSDYQLRFYLENNNGVILKNQSSFFTLAALQIEPRCLLYSTRNTRVAAGTLLKVPLPVSDHPLGSGGFDAALQFYIDHDLPPFYFTASLGAAYLSRPAYIPPNAFFPFVFPFLLSSEWALRPNLSAIVTITGTTSPFQTGYGRADKFSSTINFGGRLELGSTDSLQISMSQEFLTFAATDVALHFEWSHTFE